MIQISQAQNVILEIAFFSAGLFVASTEHYCRIVSFNVAVSIIEHEAAVTETHTQDELWYIY